MSKKISVVIPAYNGRKYFKKCLDSLFEQTYKNFEIIISDNGSDDGTVEFIEENYPKVKIIKNNKNLGFAKANNIGVKRALKEGSDYVVITCQDDYFQPDFLYEGVKVLEMKGAGMCTPKVVYDQTNVIWWAGTKLYSTKDLLTKGSLKISEHLGKGTKDVGQYNTIKEEPALTGNALFIKKEVFEKIGFFDEKYFLYGDDLDFSLRARKAGFRLLYFPFTTAYHMTPLKRSQKRSLKGLFLKFKRYIEGLVINVNRHLKWYQKYIWYVKFPFALIISFVKGD